MICFNIVSGHFIASVQSNAIQYCSSAINANVYFLSQERLAKNYVFVSEMQLRVSSITTQKCLVIEAFSLPGLLMPDNGLLIHNPPHFSPWACKVPALTSSPDCPAFLILLCLLSVPSLPLVNNLDVFFLCGSSASR